MTGLGQAMAALSQFFARYDIPTDSLTVILNIADRDAAARFDAAVKRDADTAMVGDLARRPDIRKMTINGVKVRVESPLHTP